MKVSVEATTECDPSSSSPRAASLVAGMSLALMTVIAPFGLLIALPDGKTDVAAGAVLAIATLDVVAAVALAIVLMPAGPLLAGLTAGLRITYAAVFAVAGAFLFAPAERSRFESIWDAGLLIFGVHLVVVGLAIWRIDTIPTWLGALVGIAGVGYITDTFLALASGTSFSLAAFTFVGEVTLLVWLLIRGGRPPSIAGLPRCS